MTDIEELLQENAPLAPHTTLGVGGPARFYLEALSENHLIDGLSWARARQLPLLLLGGGSNLVIPDKGFPGLVVKLAMKGRRAEEDLVHAAAGEEWDECVAWTVAQNLAGIECLSGIPGKVGAAPIQNIGAYGQELSETLEYVDLLDLSTHQRVRMSNEQCRFGYRHSIFKGEAKGRYAVVSISLRLRSSGAPTIRYRDLTERLSANASLQQARDTVLAVRREKSMVADPDDPNARGCGSFFVNPVLSEEAYQVFAARAPEDHPRYPAGVGKTKLAAAWLIEQSGFHKGFRRGNVGLSDKHCLAIVNKGGASAAEVHALAEEIKAGVKQRFGITLTPEPVLL